MTGAALASICGAAVIALMPAGTAAAQEVPPEGFTWYVLNALNAFGFDIEDPTNRPPLVTGVPEGVLVPVEINADGRTDWLINWPQDMPFCGTGGCRRSLYVSDGDGFVRAFDRQGSDIEIRQVDGETRIEASFHRQHCEEGVDDCRLAWGWNPGMGRFDERPTRAGRHRLTGPGELPVDRREDDGQDVLPDWTPDALATHYREARRLCPAGEGEPAAVVYPVLSSTPDLNGDQIRDWTLSSPPDCPDQPDTPSYGYQVWISVAPGYGPRGEGGEVVMAYRSAPDHVAQVDLGSTPARLVDVAPCRSARPCPATLLTWDPASRSLKP